MTRQRKPTLFEDILVSNMQRRRDPAARKEVWIEVLGAVQNVLDQNEVTLHQLGMPKSKRITREVRLEFIEILFSLVASSKLFTCPTTSSLLSDEDVDNLSLALGNFVDQYLAYIDSAS